MEFKQEAQEIDQDSAMDSYDPMFFDILARIEDRHFWFCTRNKVIGSFMKQIVGGLPPGYRVLEVGCGTGNVLRILDRLCVRGTVIGMDLFSQGLRCARVRTSRLVVQGDIRSPPFRGQFDVIGLFDVLEHLPDDTKTLSRLYGMLPEGGKLIVTVPADQTLWSYFDEASHHFRRYEFSELECKLKNAGFFINHLTPYMATIFPIVWLARRLSQRRGQRTGQKSGDRVKEMAMQELRCVPVVNQILSWLLRLETRWVTGGHTLPCGTSLLAIAQKPSDK
jgi:SAM-dependent methyltransferase